MTLARKVALLTTVGVVVAVVAFGLLGLRAVDQATDAMLEDRLTTAQVVADYIDEALARALTELGIVSERLADPRADLAAEVRALRSTYQRLSISLRGVYLVGDRQVFWSEPGAPVVTSQDMSLFAAFKKTTETGEPAVSPLVRAPMTEPPVVLLSVPATVGGTTRALVAAIDLSQSSIAGVVKPIRLGQTGYVELVDQNGIVIARTEPGPKLGSFEKSDHAGRFAALIATREPTKGLCHTCHEPVQKVEQKDLLALVPLARASWGVAIRQSEEEAMAPINELRQNLFLFGAVLIAVALLLVAVTTRNLVSRVKVLTVASRKMANGDMASPIRATQRDEIGVLSRSFEDMRIKLKESRDELEGRTRELLSLLSVSEILTSLADLSDLDRALAAALDKILEIMKEDTGGIFLTDDRHLLCCRAQRGLPKEAVGTCFAVGEGVVGRVAGTMKPLVIPDISADGDLKDPLFGGEGLKALASVGLGSTREVLGVLTVASRTARQFSPRDVRLLENIGGQIATAIENARLHQAIKSQDEVRGELLGEILSIQEEERKRIARELHDETSQVLASLNANLEAMSGMLPADADNIRARLKQAQALSISVLDDVHRLIYELRPILLDDLGLVAATRWLTDNNLRNAGIKVNYKTVGRAKRLSPAVESTLFRVIQEAVNNIARHARAKEAEIVLRFKKTSISVSVSDDGSGFDVDEAIRSKERPRGLGLLGMKERVELVNGTLEMASRIGGGTQISIEIPLETKGSGEARTKLTRKSIEEVKIG